MNSFDYRHDTAKIVVSSSNKENIDKFLESCENVISSSTHFNEESKILRLQLMLANFKNIFENSSLKTKIELYLLPILLLFFYMYYFIMKN